MGRMATTDESITFQQMSKLVSLLPGWLHTELKAIAKQKGVSLHVLIEIQMKRFAERFRNGKEL